MVRCKRTLKTTFLVLLVSILAFSALNMALAGKNIEKTKEIFDETKVYAQKTIQPFGIFAQDSHEPDDDNTTNTWIDPNGTQQTHSFDPQGDVDFVKFNAEKKNHILVGATNSRSTGFDWTILYL